MRNRLFLVPVGIGLLLGSACPSWAQDDPPSPPPGRSSAEAATKPDREPDRPKLESATFGGGCFWCFEAVFERIPGVKSVVSGYAGGNTRFRPTYDLVHTGLTGHAEVIRITYDPEILSFDDLLDFFWAAHDPTTLNRQGPDFGTQYRSIILYESEAQREAALASYEKLTASRAYGAPIVTELEPLRRFYPAESYHQNYYRRNRNAPYCRAEIAPKVAELQRMLEARKAETARPGRASSATSDR